MNYIKDFFMSKTGKRALWTLLDYFLATVIAFVAFLASNSVGWAVALHPILVVAFQMLTKWLMAPMVLPSNAEK